MVDEKLLDEFKEFLASYKGNTKESYLRYAREFATTDSREFNKKVSELLNNAKTSATKYMIYYSARAFEKFMRRTKQRKDFELWIERPKGKRDRPVYLTKEEIDMLINAEKSYKYKVIWKTLFNTGLRISELINLKLNDVDLVAHQIYVSAQKTEEGRVIPITSTLAKELDTYIKNYRKGNTPYLFTSKSGKQLSRIDVWKHLKKTADKVGIKKKISPHVLRHSCATYMLENGVDIRTIQQILGHKSLNTTQIYTHVVDEQKRKSISIFED